MNEISAMQTAGRAIEKADITYDLLADHIKSCASTQRWVLGMVVATLLSTIGTLVTLYVLPRTTTVTTTTVVPIEGPRR